MPHELRIRAEDIRRGDILLDGRRYGRRVHAVELVREYDGDEDPSVSYVLVDLGHGDYEEYDRYHMVAVESDMPEWERELLAPPEDQLFGPTNIPAMLSNAPGGNHMSRRTRDIDHRAKQLQTTIEQSQRELNFLNTLPAEPEVNTDAVEPVVVLVNLLHPETGEVTRSHVMQSANNSDGRYGRSDGSAVWSSDLGRYTWEHALRQLFRPECDFEVRQLNPGTVIYTTVPEKPKATRAKRA